MPQNQIVEHKVVTFAEEGCWSDEEWSDEDRRYKDPDSAEWLNNGYWRVRTYEGITLFRDKNIQLGLNWLNDNRYAACPDGEHFMKVS